MTAIAKTKIEIVRTRRSTSFVGSVIASTTTGMTSADVVNTKRPSNGCRWRVATCDASVLTLGCSKVAETKNKLAIYGALAIESEITKRAD